MAWNTFYAERGQGQAQEISIVPVILPRKKRKKVIWCSRVIGSIYSCLAFCSMHNLLIEYSSTLWPKIKIIRTRARAQSETANYQIPTSIISKKKVFCCVTLYSICKMYYTANTHRHAHTNHHHQIECAYSFKCMTLYKIHIFVYCVIYHWCFEFGSIDKSFDFLSHFMENTILW